MLLVTTALEETWGKEEKLILICKAVDINPEEFIWLENCTLI